VCGVPTSIGPYRALRTGVVANLRYVARRRGDRVRPPDGLRSDPLPVHLNEVDRGDLAPRSIMAMSMAAYGPRRIQCVLPSKFDCPSQPCQRCWDDGRRVGRCSVSACNTCHLTEPKTGRTTGVTSSQQLPVTWPCSPTSRRQSGLAQGLRPFYCEDTRTVRLHGQRRGLGLSR
jgi:hypothetical protein